MAMYDDERRRRSYFPAANTGQYLIGGVAGRNSDGSMRSFGSGPSTAALNRPGQEWGSPVSLGQGTPAQRQSMQLAADRGRLSPEDFSKKYPNAVPIGGRQRQLDTYQTPLPEGGFSTIRVAAGSRAPASARPYQQFTPTPAQVSAIQASGRAQGFGGVPSYNPATSTISSGGVEQPIEQATAAQRFQFGVPTFGQRLGENPFGTIGTLAYNALGSVANLFRGNQQPPAQRPISQSYANYSNNPRQPRRMWEDYL